MKIVKYQDCYAEAVKDLICDLQDYLIGLDECHIQMRLQDYREKCFDSMMDEIAENKGIIYLAIEDNKVLGFISGIVEVTDEFDSLFISLKKSGRITELCIEESSRSKGIGVKLLHETENYLKCQGCEFVYIEVFGPNKKAFNFYDKNGYNLRNIEVMKKI